MTKKSDLLDIDLHEELATIRAQKAEKNVLRKKTQRPIKCGNNKAPSGPDTGSIFGFVGNIRPNTS
ncbi:MAG: hypothetical protein NUV86_02800 [Candidatus Scalindua sp.]|nr:hypothetical protein [Candidatus Scalindua sp.]MCR4344020.1 hypothetical protein [Candidatus Scalindua sp.]